MASDPKARIAEYHGDDARQRAREAAHAKMRDAYIHDRGAIVAALEVYFDERMRGEAPTDVPTTPAPWGSLPDDKHDTNYGRVCTLCRAPVRANERYAHGRSVCAPPTTEDAALLARVAELEAVVRAADAMRQCKAVHDEDRFGRHQDDCDLCANRRVYDAVRAKVEVPGE